MPYKELNESPLFSFLVVIKRWKTKAYNILLLPFSRRIEIRLGGGNKTEEWMTAVDPLWFSVLFFGKQTKLSCFPLLLCSFPPCIFYLPASTWALSQQAECSVSADWFILVTKHLLLEQQSIVVMENWPPQSTLGLELVKMYHWVTAAVHIVWHKNTERKHS